MDRVEHGSASGAANSDIKIWDTRSVPKAPFMVFREAICSTFMRWSPEIDAALDFQGRVEGTTLGAGALARISMTPITAIRNKADVAASSISCVYANYVLSGELNIEQRGRSVTAKQGDLAIYDSLSPVVLTERNDGHFENLAFLIPKDMINNMRDPDAQLGNMVISADRMMQPLAKTMTFLAQNFPTLSVDELTALFDASVSMIPVAAGCRLGVDRSRSIVSNPKKQEVFELVDLYLANSEFSARHAADHLGVSPRYIHKVFAEAGTTFGAYLSARRLDYVKCDLKQSNQHISVIAYRWGFSDLSTFNRQFKARFGVTPGEFRLINAV